MRCDCKTLDRFTEISTLAENLVQQEMGNAFDTLFICRVCESPFIVYAHGKFSSQNIQIKLKNISEWANLDLQAEKVIHMKNTYEQSDLDCQIKHCNNKVVNFVHDIKDKNYRYCPDCWVYRRNAH